MEGDGQREIGLGAGVDFLFEVIGVQVDHAGDQPLAVEIHAFGEVAVGQDLGDTVVFNNDGAGDGGVGQNDTGVGEDGAVHGRKIISGILSSG